MHPCSIYNDVYNLCAYTYQLNINILFTLFIERKRQSPKVQIQRALAVEDLLVEHLLVLPLHDWKMGVLGSSTVGILLIN